MFGFVLEEKKSPTKLAKTGQKIVKTIAGRPYFACACCKNENKLINEFEAWLDCTIMNDANEPSYVHFECLSLEAKSKLTKKAA